MTTSPELAQAAASAQAWPPILAIDPGSQSTGLCLRVGTDALEAVTVERNVRYGGDGHEQPSRYAMAVIETCREVTRRNRDALNAEAQARGVPPGGLRHAAETLVPPSPRPVRGRQAAVAPRVLEYLPGAATVLGAVVGTWPQTILVPPRGGSEGGWDALPGAPENLRGRTPSNWLAGGSDRSHQRSAWAIAGAAHVIAAPPVPEQVRAAANAAAALSPGLAPEALVPALRAAIQQSGSWDLLDRLPALAAASVAVMTHGDREAAEFAREAVSAYLEGEAA
ncbi:hypothetical protein GCM10027030_05180 [Luteococcus sediminum]